MTDLETAVRKALGLHDQRHRVMPLRQADDEAVAAILLAAGSVAGEQVRAQPDGIVIADGPEAAGALVALKERAEGMEALVAEMRGSFTERSNGWMARVGSDKVGEWDKRREELGE